VQGGTTFTTVGIVIGEQYEEDSPIEVSSENLVLLIPLVIDSENESEWNENP